MKNILFAFTSCACITALVLKYSNIHIKFSGDSKFNEPQKIHSNVVPRIGGLAIFISYLSTLLLFSPSYESSLIALTALPVFIIGFLEDLLKKIQVKTRLLVCSIGAISACLIFNISINKIDIYFIDAALEYKIFAYFFTIFCILGLINAYNIIDGLNGLSSMIAILASLALAYVSYKNYDYLLAFFALTFAASIFGFFIFNFPFGLIFLGDGGSYFLGYTVAIMSIALPLRNQEVSPWVAICINAYPITETIFTIARRISKKVSISYPDNLHLHSALHKKAIKQYPSQNKNIQNSLISPYLWIYACLTLSPALFFWQNTFALLGCYITSVFIYIIFYSDVTRVKF